MPNACASSKIPTIMDVFDLDFGDSKVKIENELVRDELVELNGFERAVENFSRSRRVSECSSRASSASSTRSGSKVAKKGKRKSSKGNVLHFLKRLLDDKEQTMIQWTNQDTGVFKIMNPNQLLEVWNKSKKRSAKSWNHFA